MTDHPAPPTPSIVLHDVPGAAALLGVDRSLVYREIHAGRLKALRIGHKLLRVPQAEIEAYIRARMAEFVAGEDDFGNDHRVLVRPGRAPARLPRATRTAGRPALHEESHAADC